MPIGPRSRSQPIAMLSNRPLLPSSAAAVLCGLIHLACDSQVGTDYPGEPLASVAGEVKARDVGSTAQDVAVLWLSSSAEQECSGPGLSCIVSVGGGPMSDPQCVLACGQSLECSEQGVEAWAMCVEGCGNVVNVMYETEWELCADTTIGETISVTGEFPAAFTLDLFHPPPAEAMMAGEDGLSVALGYFIATDPEAGPIALPQAPGDPPPAGIVGGSEDHMLIYAADPIPADSPWGQMLGGAYEPGYHVLEVVDGGMSCYPDPAGGEICVSDPDTLTPAPDDLATPIALILGGFEQIDWPSIG